jgi:hypothetical protein
VPYRTLEAFPIFRMGNVKRYSHWFRKRNQRHCIPKNNDACRPCVGLILVHRGNLLIECINKLEQVGWAQGLGYKGGGPCTAWHEQCANLPYGARSYNGEEVFVYFLFETDDCQVESPLYEP